MTSLQSRNLSVGYDRRIVVEDLSVHMPVGKMTAIVGGNGSGKSTLLKAFARVLRPLSGAVVLDERALQDLPSRALARRLSILPQTAQAPESLTVGELVTCGRHPHRRWLRGTTRADLDAVKWALDVTGTTRFEDRPIGSLSGGQRQRVWIAMTLAQGAEILLLDEPTSYLDACHQLEVMELLARLHRDEGKTILLALHDLNLAARYVHHMIALDHGRVVAAGTPREVMTEETLRTVFGIRAHITSDPVTGSPMCIAYLPAATER